MCSLLIGPVSTLEIRMRCAVIANVANEGYIWWFEWSHLHLNCLRCEGVREVGAVVVVVLESTCCSFRKHVQCYLMIRLLSGWWEPINLPKRREVPRGPSSVSNRKQGKVGSTGRARNNSVDTANWLLIDYDKDLFLVQWFLVLSVCAVQENRPLFLCVWVRACVSQNHPRVPILIWRLSAAPLPSFVLSSKTQGDFSTGFTEFSWSRVSVVKQSVQNQRCGFFLDFSFLLTTHLKSRVTKIYGFRSGFETVISYLLLVLHHPSHVECIQTWLTDMTDFMDPNLGNTFLAAALNWAFIHCN